MTFDYDPDTFFGSAERELVVPGIEARVACDAIPAHNGSRADIIPMEVSCFRTRGDDE